MAGIDKSNSDRNWGRKRLPQLDAPRRNSPHGICSPLETIFFAGPAHPTRKHLETQWKRFVPDAPFEYHFLDEIIRWYYFDEQLTGKMLGVFSLLAIFVACLGLFGLAAFMVQSRTKEIGIRKVLGASTPHLVILLAREFIFLVLLANLIAWPIAYYLMRDWLSGFAYQTDLNVLPFVASAIMALIIAFGTVSMQAIRAARSNPIDALRYE